MLPSDPTRKHLAFAGLILFSLFGCRGEIPVSHKAILISGDTMGTVYKIKVSGPPDGLTDVRLQQEVDARLKYINDRMSTYLPESEISRFNRFRGEDWFEVSADTVTVVAGALQVSDGTDGAFDVTVGPLVNLWSFGPENQPKRIPSEDEIADAKAKTGVRLIEVRRQPPALRKTQPEVYVDLSGIAKGFAVDAIAELFEQRGIERFMIEIGGEVRTSGRKQDGTPFSRADIDFLNMVLIKPSGYREMLQRLGLMEEQSVYLGHVGHIGEQDAMFSIKEGLRTGRLQDGDLMVIVAAGIGYVWAAGVVQWGQQ